MEKRLREGEELYEMAAAHLAPDICLSSDGLGVAAVEEGQFAAGRDWSRSWVEVQQQAEMGSGCRHCSALDLTFHLISVLHELLNTPGSAQLITDSCMSWMQSELAFASSYRPFFTSFSINSCISLLWEIKISLPYCLTFNGRWSIQCPLE